MTNTIDYRPRLARQDEIEAYEWRGVRIGIHGIPGSPLCGITVNLHGHSTQDYWSPGELPLDELRAELESVFLSVPR